jgi:acyl dehydratase
MPTLREIPEEVRGWIGRTLVEDAGEFPIEQGYIFSSCASVENGNPLFWDSETAAALTAGPVAPPTMLSVWLRPHHWAPGRTGERLPLEVHFRLKRLLDLPEAIIAANELTFGEPVRPGDRLRARQTLRSISEPKTNKLGTGRFWAIDVEYFNQRGEWVGTDSYECFGYRRD